MQTEKTTTKGPLTMLVITSKKNANDNQNNLDVLAKLLDAASPCDYVELLEIAFEAYLTSDYYASADKHDRESHYSQSKVLMDFFKTLN